MTDTEAKALALVNEVRRQAHIPTTVYHEAKNLYGSCWEGLCRVIEAQEATEARHAAEMREQAERFSEAAKAVQRTLRANQLIQAQTQAILSPFILPAPDPLAEAVGDALEAQGMGRPTHTTPEIAEQLRAAIEARGGKIVWLGGGE